MPAFVSGMPLKEDSLSELVKLSLVTCCPSSVSVAVQVTVEPKGTPLKETVSMGFPV